MAQPVAPSLEALLSGATDSSVFGASDGKSQALMEKVSIGGRSHVVKHLHVDDDWIARGYGDLRGRPVAVWRAGVLAALPPCLDSAVVGAVTGLGRNGWGAAVLMRDVGDLLVPAGDDSISLEQHLRFLAHMAALHATFWGFEDADDLLGLTPFSHRWAIFGPYMLAAESERGRGPDPWVPAVAAEGWDRFATRAPAELRTAVEQLRRDLDPLTTALANTPCTLVHGDWKLGNLGSHPDGRTILLDWQSPGRGPAASDLCWYLALNAARLPQTKEEAIGAYRAALEAEGIETGEWWDRQLALCQLGTVVQFGWEKALGGDDELGWWCDRAGEGTHSL